ncbi:MAG: zinc ribbon domain-containing protein [Microcella sp.]|uniref:zinc ribbon domain-containing protein n=1 Tax=Microcella sp. TaxID=1913979 RepID=UPI0027208E35|nr:zinc ribbon domain-containing protein [Microcella sp.]MDO8338988.1 zinc ribbon domain-containing protein [Microcella sp.]
MAACPNCASPLRDGLRFCTQCGTALLAPIAETPADLPSAPPTASPDPFVESPTDAGFDPVPALGPHAAEPLARPSILGLLVSPSPSPESPDGGDDEAADDEAPEAEALEERIPDRPAPLHPLGVPVISARKPLGPGANPTHIGRASSYITAPPAVAAASAPVALPASAVSASPPDPAPSPPVEHSVPSPVAHSAPVPSAPSSAPLDRQPAGRTSGRRYSPPPARSTAATWALVTGLLPLLVSIFGNAVTTELGTQALKATASGVTSGAWAPVFVALSLVFVSNAALLTVCAITGVRGIRETSNGVTRGRPLAVSGLAAGAVNVVLLVAGLVISISGLSAVLA